MHIHEATNCIVTISDLDSAPKSIYLCLKEKLSVPNVMSNWPVEWNVQLCALSNKVKCTVSLQMLWDRYVMSLHIIETLGMTKHWRDSDNNNSNAGFGLQVKILHIVL
jgi:hypothetical protein